MIKPILLAEDDERDLELTLLALGSSELANEVIVVRDGAAVLDYLHLRGDWSDRAPGNPAVILLDLKMPKVDGLEVLEAMRRSKGLSIVPVVMLTSSQEESDVLRSYQLGVNAYVVKPVDLDQYLRAVSELGVFWAMLNEPPPGSLRSRQGRHPGRPKSEGA